MGQRSISSFTFPYLQSLVFFCMLIAVTGVLDLLLAVFGGVFVKIIALIPFRNEERFLPVCLASLQGLADGIIGVDDGSTDSSARLFEQAGGLVLPMDSRASSFSEGKEWAIRRKLLEEGRRQGGTHFIWLDADEALTATFRKHGRDIIAALPHGHQLALELITVWGSPYQYRAGDYSKWQGAFCACIVHDSPEPEEQGSGAWFLHGNRALTPPEKGRVHKLPLEWGGLFHFFAVSWEAYSVKQAWYFCIERKRTPNEVERINCFYAPMLDTTHVKTKAVPTQWLEGLPVNDAMGRIPPGWQWTELQGFFDTLGIEFFEPMEIWHVPRLHAEFVRRTGREPAKPTLGVRLRRAWRREKKRSQRFVVAKKRALVRVVRKALGWKDPLGFQP